MKKRKARLTSLKSGEWEWVDENNNPITLSEQYVIAWKDWIPIDPTLLFPLLWDAGLRGDPSNSRLWGDDDEAFVALKKHDYV